MSLYCHYKCLKLQDKIKRCQTSKKTKNRLTLKWQIHGITKIKFVNVKSQTWKQKSRIFLKKISTHRENPKSKNKKCKQKTFGLGKVTWSTCRESVKDKSLASRENFAHANHFKVVPYFRWWTNRRKKEWVKRLDSFFIFAPFEMKIDVISWCGGWWVHLITFSLF